MLRIGILDVVVVESVGDQTSTRGDESRQKLPLPGVTKARVRGRLSLDPSRRMASSR